MRAPFESVKMPVANMDSLLSILDEQNSTNSHTVFTSVRQIMQVKVSTEADDRTELAFIQSTLSNLKVFANDPARQGRTTASLIFHCYWVYAERIDKRVNDLKSLQLFVDNGLAYLRWDRWHKLRQSRELIKQYWTFNYTLLSILTMLDL